MGIRHEKNKTLSGTLLYAFSEVKITSNHKFQLFLMSSYSAEFRRVSFEHKASRLSSLFFFYLLLIKPIHRKEMSLKKGEVNLGVGLSLYEIEINHS